MSYAFVSCDCLSGQGDLQGPDSSLVEASWGEKQVIPDAEVPEHDGRHAPACYAFAA
jgi:hypothetical protein